MSKSWQLSALMKKNWILMKRNCCTTCCEFLFPIILMVLLALVRRAIKIDTFLQPTDLNDFMKTNSSALLDSPVLQQITSQGSSTWNGLTIPSIGDDVSTSAIQSKILSLAGTQASTLSFKNFSSVAEMNSYVADPSYSAAASSPAICFGFYFKRVDSQNYNYSLHYFDNFLRNGIQNTPNTLTASLDPFQVGPDMSSYGRWLNSGYLQMMQIINQQILQQSSGNKNATINFGMMAQQYTDYQNDPFGNFMNGLLPFFLIIAYLCPLCVLVFRMVQEKESRAKEGMKIMGLNESVYFMSYFIQWMIQNIFYGLIVSAILKRVLTTVGFIHIFAFIWLFGMTIFALAYFFQAMFDKTRIAMIMTILIYFIMYFVSTAVLSDDVENIAKMVISLLPPTCIQLGIVVMGKFVTNNIQFTSAEVSYPYNNFSVGNMYAMLVIDFFVYLFLGYYRQNVLSHQFGLKKALFFMCSRSYWSKKPRITSQTIEEKSNNYVKIEIGKSEEETNFQSEQLYDEKLKSGDCLQIKNLKKVFDDEKVALDGLNLNLYNEEIFALLGHNGAGKSTTISIMCGLYEATGGSATYKGVNIFEGNNMEDFRKKLGICPQHDVLFGDLTVREHLEMFSVFKGDPSDQRDEEINQIINDVQLTDKADECAKKLSGGQKRKLSIALALVGGSEVVFLDEPSSGMDITSRRNLWNILKKCVGNRIIVLTTHYMEEAAVLGNRIGIVSNGKMKCCGNGLFLIDKFGKYISLNLSKKPQADDEQIINWVKERMPEVEYEILSEEILFKIPKDESTSNVRAVGRNNMSLKIFFGMLDQDLTRLGLKSYSATMPTLEDVFLKVSADNKINLNNGNMNSGDASAAVMSYKREDGSSFAKFFTDLKCSLKKRLYQIIRDKKTFILEILCPIVLVLFGLGVSSIQFIKESPSLNVNLNLLPANETIVINSIYNNGSPEATRFTDPAVKFDYQATTVTASLPTALQSYNQFLYSLNYTNSYGSFYILNFDTTNNNYEFVTFTNTQSRNAPIIYTQYMMSQIISKASGVKINFSHEPLPIPFTLKKQGQTRNYSNLVFFISIAFALIPANFITIIIKERETNTKHLQLISGISLSSYWISNFIFELVKYYFIGGINLLIIYAFGNFPYWLWLLYLMYGFSMVSFTYMFALFFKTEATAQNYVILVNFVFGALGGTVILVLRSFVDLVSIAKGIAAILRVVPSFAFAYGFNELLSAQLLFSIDYPDTFFLMLLNSDDNIIKMEYVGGDIIYMAIEFLVFSLILIIWESSGNCCKSKRSRSSLDTATLNDSLVRNEIEKANSSRDDKKYSIRVKNLEKSFSTGMCKKHNLAVDKLSFCLEYGECFALLGVNGAGKTTTFKSLTAEHSPSNGDIFIDGMDITSDFNKVRNMIGYCPQFDAIFDYMTVYENLDFYARVKGLPSDKVDIVVTTLMTELNLAQYRDKVSGNLSGGNKRKLSVGIAMIGNPPIVLLDEPSTGMDPEARRFMWSVIHKISTRSKKSSVILTTHSMEEAETLCRRMGIMVAGQFKCLGTSQNIKDKYGYGYEIDLRIQLMPAQVYEDIMKTNNLNGDEVITNPAGVTQILTRLGKTHYSDQLTKKGFGKEIVNEISNKGKISVRKIVEWSYYTENAVRSARRLSDHYGDIYLVEFNDNVFKLKVKKNEDGSCGIGFLFGLVEDMKPECSLAEYSISQTSLEQIFNKFAMEGTNQKKKKEIKLTRELVDAILI